MRASALLAAAAFASIGLVTSASGAVRHPTTTTNPNPAICAAAKAFLTSDNTLAKLVAVRKSLTDPTLNDADRRVITSLISPLSKDLDRDFKAACGF